MARIFGTVLILAGCAGFLYKWAEGEKARQRMAEEWIRLFVRWGYALEQEHVRLYDFLSFYETADASMQAFLDEVCVLISVKSSSFMISSASAAITFCGCKKIIHTNKTDQNKILAIFFISTPRSSVRSAATKPTIPEWTKQRSIILQTVQSVLRQIHIPLPGRPMRKNRQHM